MCRTRSSSVHGIHPIPSAVSEWSAVCTVMARWDAHGLGSLGQLESLGEVHVSVHATPDSHWRSIMSDCHTLITFPIMMIISCALNQKMRLFVMIQTVKSTGKGLSSLKSYSRFRTGYQIPLDMLALWFADANNVFPIAKCVEVTLPLSCTHVRRYLELIYLGPICLYRRTSVYQSVPEMAES